jgi:uracil-DNA glycosylase family 4
MNEPEIMMNHNQANLLKEMGIGPVWKLRHDAPVPIELAARSEPLIEQMSEQLSAAPSGQPSEPLNEPLNESLSDQFNVPQVVAPIVAVVSGEDDDVVRAYAVEPQALTLVEDARADSAPQASALLRVQPEPELPAVAVGAVNAAVIDTPHPAVCLCGLSSHPDEALFDEKNPRPDYLFVYCDAVAGERPRDHSSDSARVLFENMLLAMDVRKGGKAYLSNVFVVQPSVAAAESDTVLGADYSVCLSCLARQIKLMQPAVIVALGSAVTSTLLGSGKGPIAALRGQLQQFENVPLVVTTDPRYLLSRPLEKAKAWSDLCLAMSACSPA